jgi:hypothetical protein
MSSEMLLADKYLSIINDIVEVSGEPVAVKACAVSRTERITTIGGRSSGYMTPKRTTYLDPKGRGNKSMSIKRRMPEDVYGMALQRLSDMAKSRLTKPQYPAVDHTFVGSTSERRCHM